jgi:hypothetical protein
MKLGIGDFPQILLWAVELQLNPPNLKSWTQNAVLGFFIVPHNIFDISRRNFNSGTSTECSYGCFNFSLIDLNESLVYMGKFRNL